MLNRCGRGCLWAARVVALPASAACARRRWRCCHRQRRRVHVAGVPESSCLCRPWRASSRPLGGRPRRPWPRPSALSERGLPPAPGSLRRGSARSSPDGAAFNRADGRPRIALLVVGLGLQAELTDAAIRLPARSACSSRSTPPIYRAGSSAPVAPGTRSCSICRWSRRTTRVDPGPHRCSPAIRARQSATRLVLARARGLRRARRRRARLAASPACPCPGPLARRGLGLIEIGHDDLAAGARGRPALRQRTGAFDQVPSSGRSIPRSR